VFQGSVGRQSSSRWIYLAVGCMSASLLFTICFVADCWLLLAVVDRIMALGIACVLRYPSKIPTA
jgi:hypothetical protein